MSEMSYSTVTTTITKYVPHMLPSFADRWSRWPVGAAATEIARELEKIAECRDQIGLPETAAECRQCARAIRIHAKGE